jgi:hypothetical protein
MGLAEPGAGLHEFTRSLFGRHVVRKGDRGRYDDAPIGLSDCYRGISWGFYLRNFWVFQRLFWKEHVYDGFLIRWVRASTKAGYKPVWLKVEHPLYHALFKKRKWSQFFFMPFYTVLKTARWCAVAFAVFWVAGLVWTLLSGAVITFTGVRVPPGLWGIGGLWELPQLWPFF